MTPPQASSALPVPAADSGGLRGFEEAVNDVVGPFADWLSSVVFYAVPLPGGSELPLVVLWLVAAGVIITAYLGVVQVRGARLSLEVVRGKFSRPDDPGEITHFQALSSALSGTVGLGNIAGVGAALALGGAGATFWMVVCGLLGMATKFAECTLGVKYRTVNADGSISGGPFKYLPVAFRKFSTPVATVLTGVFAIAILLFGVAEDRREPRRGDLDGVVDGFDAGDLRRVRAGCAAARHASAPRTAASNSSTESNACGNTAATVPSARSTTVMGTTRGSSRAGPTASKPSW